MRIANAAAAATLSLFSFACATSGAGYSRVSVKTVALEQGARDARGIQPVGGVAVSVKCPNAADKQLGKTEADGTLKVEADQNVPLDCNLALTQAGFRDEQYKVSTVCAETAAGNCLAVDVRSILSRSAEAHSAGGKQ